jgi:protein O-GlcNAc transferase
MVRDLRGRWKKRIEICGDVGVKADGRNPMKPNDDTGIPSLLVEARRCFDAGRLPEAENLCRKLLTVKPGEPGALHLLGRLAHRGRRPDIALGLIRQSIAIQPDNADAHLDLANVLVGMNRLEEATRAAETAVAAAPGSARAHFILGTMLLLGGEIDRAVTALNEALKLDPDFADAHSNLANAMVARGRIAEAIAHFGRCRELQPSSAQANRNLGGALAADGQFDQAIDVLQRAIAMDPKDSDTYCHLGSAFKGVGRIEQALECYDRALACRPENVLADSNHIYLLGFRPGLGAQAILHEQQMWNRHHAERLAHLIVPHGNDRDPRRRLRIGYVSADFRDHPVGRNILPLLRDRDRGQFEVFCFFNSARRDGLTEMMRSYADDWRDIASMNDVRCAQLIRDDRIDILVDLSLHTAGNRLLVFAQKPAPVQVTFAGYPGGTGLATMDWRLTDPYLDPPGQTDADYVERSYRLANSFWCYDPAAMQWKADATAQPPTVGVLPALGNGWVRFGCLNTFCKVNEDALKLWSRILRQVPSSRLALLAPEGKCRQSVLATLGREGVDAGRVDFVSRQPREAYLAEFAGIDLGLDTLPYNGHTTSLDSLWMGVPVVTRVGDTVVGRAGWSQLSNLQLTQLAAHDDEQFVSVAVELAGDLDRLAELRRSMRDRMLASPLTDARRFTADVETAYRDIWRSWCDGRAK